MYTVILYFPTKSEKRLIFNRRWHLPRISQFCIYVIQLLARVIFDSLVVFEFGLHIIHVLIETKNINKYCFTVYFSITLRNYRI